jgi:molybdate transport system ATP-binding protein
MNDGIRARFRVDYPGFCLDLDLSLPGRGISALFGHSGCGKTTALRCIAGLERAQEGYLSVNGELWQDDTSGFFLPTHRRPLGYVFQEASLFPHLSVRHNLEYGQRRSGSSGGHEIWEQAVALLGIGHLMERRPERLSGGERQRVAIARALLTNPGLLLMDEPLAALDLKRKQEILPYLERLHDELAIPILYVSHQPDEVARLADHLVLLDGGKTLASGPVRELMARLDLPTALEEDAGAVIEATVGQHDAAYHLTRLDFCGGAIWASRHDLALGQRVRLQVLARDVSLALSDQGGSSILNRLAADVVDIAGGENPAHVVVRLNVGGTPLLARITRRSCDQLGLAIGAQVWAQIKAVALLA